jgi:hypothetical protein
MANALPSTSGLRLRGDTNLHVVASPQLFCGEAFTHLRLHVKHGGYSFHMSEGIGNSESRLAGVAAGTLRKYANSHPQQSLLGTYW